MELSLELVVSVKKEKRRKVERKSRKELGLGEKKKQEKLVKKKRKPKQIYALRSAD